MTSAKCNLPVLVFPAFPVLVLLFAWPAALDAEILGARPLPSAPATVASAAPRAGRALAAWPPPAPPPALRVVPREDDDSPGRWLQVRFRAGAINLDAERLDDWLRLAAPAAHQLEWVSRWSPSVRMGLSQAPATVLPNLSDPAWERYLAALRREWGGQLRFVADDDTQRNTDMTRVLGARTRVVIYELTLPANDGLRRRNIQVAVELPAGVVVFDCAGSADKVVGMSPVFERLLNRAELAAAP